MSIIEPRILKGTRDFGPEEMAKRAFVIDQISSVFALHGYDKIMTPAIEYAETILGKYGDEGDQLTYTFEDNGGRKIALRYDQTVPTARFVAANQGTLEFPFKRSQIGPVWRADKPQRGRYREFVQCDIDIVGSTSLNADAEITKVISDVFNTIGLKSFVIRINSRKLLDAILDECEVNLLDRVDVIRTIDKLDKIGLNKVKKELESIISKPQVKKLSALALDKKVQHSLTQLPESEAKSEVQLLMKKIKALGVKPKNIVLDLTLARGLDYYTGTIYEVITDDKGLGSICGGGRYDDLTELFSNQKFPGVGVAFGLDRIILALENTGKLKDVSRNSQVMIINFADTEKGNLALLSSLQNEGIRSEIYLEDAKIQKQFKYADKKGIPWVIMQGSDEVKKKKVMLRNMKTGKQELLTIKQLVKKLLP